VGTTTAGAALSFFPTKNLGALGDAGALLTNDDALAARTRLLRVHGDAGDYRHTALGTNARLDGLQAALLRVKLRHLESWTEARRANAARYREALAGTPVTLPVEPEGARHTYHQFTIRAPRRDALQTALRDRGIATRIYYPIPVPLQPCFDPEGRARGRYPMAETLAGDVLSLPVGPEVTPESIERVGRAVREFYGPGGGA
jgi:dTDP-4-amino-4,6-dideoxygalactose transaminase